jgi:uncharacterized protein (TIGR03437 family)
VGLEFRQAPDNTKAPRHKDTKKGRFEVFLDWEKRAVIDRPYSKRLFLVSLCLGVFVLSTNSASAANIGAVVPVLGQVADLVHDPARNLVYLANPSRNQVEIYSVSTGRITGSIATGLQPASLAMSLDGNTLYAANVGSFTISVISLAAQRADTDFFVGSRPDAIAVGSDGKIVILGTAGLVRLDPATGQIQPVPISPPPTPPAGLPITPVSPTPAGFLAGLVATANGNLIIGMSTNRLFVYEVASGTVLRSRNVTGLRAILSAAPDGSRFMAGPFLFDTQTMAILGRTGRVSPTLTGGSTFSRDGNQVYATFSTQPAINPLNTTTNPQSVAVGPGGLPPPVTGVTQGVLQILRSSSLTPDLGLRLAEPIASKIISSVDGALLFANSSSGLLVIPVGQLANLPILDVSVTNVVLSVDMCNRTIATATVQIRNAGGGRMTFAASVNNAAAPVILNQRTGIAPATLNISFDPRTVTVRGTLQYVVWLVSPEAVNIEPAILVNLNFRDVSDRGTILPMTGVGVDMQMDAARQRLYIANFAQDQIEVFSLTNQTFLPPIRVGNRPISMAMVNPSTLVVANSGAENVSIVDLDLMAEVEQIGMGPIPLNATPLFPRSVAASANAVLFSAIPLPATAGLMPGNGSIWQLSLTTHSAFPRLNLGLGAANVINGRNLLAAPADGSAIVVAEGNGTLRLYDPIADTFAVTRALAVPGLRGTASSTADGSFYVIDNLVFNSVLVSQGALATAPPGAIGGAAQAALAFGTAISGNNVVRVQAATAQTPVQSLQRFNLATLQPNLQLFLPEPVMDISPAQLGLPNGTRQWPPRAIALEIGVNNQAQLLPRGMVTDASNNAYLLTVSGLTIVSLTSATGQTPSFSAAGVVNRASGARLLSPGSLIRIQGANLALEAMAEATPLPRTLGGICITANEIAIPLLSTSPTLIEAQLPNELPPGRITLTVRSTRLGVSSAGVQLQLTPTAPGIFAMDIGDGQQRALLFHAVDGTLVVPAYPADRDEVVVLYATGLGPADPPVPTGQLNPAEPVSPTTEPVSVSIGGHPHVVLWSGLAPGYVGIYQIYLYVPGDRVRGDNLAVVVTAGATSSDSAPNASPPITSIQ